ncbi:TPA: hypothetical protein ACUNBL_003755, partial [Stenotrophomonas maltophilia]
MAPTVLPTHTAPPRQIPGDGWSIHAMRGWGVSENKKGPDPFSFGKTDPAPTHSARLLLLPLLLIFFFFFLRWR